MEIEMNYEVFDCLQQRYRKITEDFIIKEEKYVVYRAVTPENQNFIVKLFFYQNTAEMQKFYKVMKLRLEHYKEFLADLILLQEPFMGYVIPCDENQNFFACMNRNEKMRFLRRITNLMQEFNESGAVFCGSFEEAFLCSGQGVKFCAPECLVKSGFFTKRRGKPLLRAPETISPLGRIASKQEFSYQFACIIAQLFLGQYPYEWLLKANIPESEISEQNQEPMEFELEGDFEDDEEEEEQTESPEELEDPKKLESISREQLEQRILHEKLPWLDNSNEEENERRRFLVSDELMHLIDTAITADVALERRPDFSEWYPALRECCQGIVLCSKCQNWYNVRYYLQAFPDAQICMTEGCGSPLPKLCRILISELFIKERKSEFAEMQFSDEEMKGISGNFRKVIGERVYFYEKSGSCAIGADEFYQEDYLKGRALLFCKNDSGVLSAVIPNSNQYVWNSKVMSGSGKQILKDGVLHYELIAGEKTVFRMILKNKKILQEEPFRLVEIQIEMR